jgi:predicted dehydrogenase
MMNNVRFGIIGLGMGSHHAGYLFGGEVPGATLTAICDIDQVRLQGARKRFGEKLTYFEDAAAMYASGLIDAVIIATPHYLHPPLAIAAFGRGLHVLSEKPAGVFGKQVREMNAVAAKSGKVFGIMFQMRTDPGKVKLKELIAAGELGELRRNQFTVTDWFRPQVYYDSGGWRATWAGEGGGVLLNQCPHSLDFWQWSVGMPKRVRAFCSFGKYQRVEVEDAVHAYAEYPNGATGTFTTTTGEAPGANTFEVAGDRGKLVMEGNRVTLYRTRDSVEHFLNTSKAPFDMPECWRCEIPVGSQGGEHKRITVAFVQAVLTGSPLIARGEEGLNSLELSNAMLLSTWTNDWVSLPVDEELYLKMLKERIASSTLKKKDAGGKSLDFSSSFKI